MVQSERFKVAGKEHEVCKLRKLLYWLKQSLGQWYRRFDKFMMESKYTRNEIEKLKTRLKSKFEIKDLGEATMILGIEIVRDRKLRKLCLTQKQYLRRVLKHFRVYMEKVPYANAVGSLMYAMICIRPNISHVVGMGLVFEHGSSQWVAEYCDFDYTGDLDKRRSTTDYVFTLAKPPISWKSTLQITTALSTTKAKYMVITEVVREAIWLQGLLVQLLFGLDQYFENLKIGLKTPPRMINGILKNLVFAKVEICETSGSSHLLEHFIVVPISELGHLILKQITQVEGISHL
ncbi:retrovirus-related pol polyprotein from transposon TNT 1-94 [Tanacetum coccineum]